MFLFSLWLHVCHDEIKSSVKSCLSGLHLCQHLSEIKSSCSNVLFLCEGDDAHNDLGALMNSCNTDAFANVVVRS